ncbi:MAG TPA: hypothetical protein VGG75_42570 [Trebonia sp.]
MKIRIMGTREELAAFDHYQAEDVHLLIRSEGSILLAGEVVELSAFYPNHGNSKLGRVYLEVQQ